MSFSFASVDRWIFRLLSVAGCIAIASLAIICLYQVFSRFVLEAPTVWSEALARTLMVWAVFLGTPVAIRRGMAITMSVLAEMSPPPMRRLIDLLVTLAIALALFIVLWQGILLIQRIANQRLAGLDIPIIWAYAAIPVGAAFSLLALACRQVEARGASDISTSSAFEGDTI